MIDHVFMLVDPAGPEIAQMARLGLTESYRRVHPGQGTRNVCYGFDNLFLELLWVDDADAARSPVISRTRLYERSLWRRDPVCPFGIAWRTSPAQAGPAIPTWPFAPPYLPAGMTIAVAEDGDDPRQPMMFRSPGSTAPIDWPADKRGSLQHDRHLGAVRDVRLSMPPWAPPCAALEAIAAACQPPLTLDRGDRYRLSLRITGLDGYPDLTITLPVDPA